MSFEEQMASWGFRLGRVAWTFELSSRGQGQIERAEVGLPPLAVVDVKVDQRPKGPTQNDRNIGIGMLSAEPVEVLRRLSLVLPAFPGQPAWRLLRPGPNGYDVQISSVQVGGGISEHHAFTTDAPVGEEAMQKAP